MDLNRLTIKKTHERLKRKEFSAVELAQEFYKKILETDSTIGAYLNLTDELAMPQAKAIDEKIKRGEEIGPLGGVPLAIKDNILVKNFKCTASSKILENYIAPYDATVTEKLKEAGALFLGKTNMDEFAMGSSTETSAFKKTRNPRDLSRVPGGSSGGSAAAVASDMCVAALGSDTGGSIRQPASFCGVVGLKPTYGAVSRYGLMSMASSLDQIGPLTKTVEDAEIIFNAIKGKDPMDATSIESQGANRKARIAKNITIGIPKEYFVEGLDKKTEKIMRDSIQKLEKAGCVIKEISLSHTAYALSVYYLLMPAEVSSNLARYDGIRYGYSSGGRDLMEVYEKSRGKGFGTETRRRIMLGTYILSHGYYDAYYLHAQKVRTRIIEDFRHVFANDTGVDVILTPTTPNPAFKFGEKTDDPLTMYLEDIFTVPVNIAGLPAISIPATSEARPSGRPAENNASLPIGAQFIAPWFEEETLFKVGTLFETIR